MYWILKKISSMFITLYGVVTIIFFLFNVLPGDPAQMMLDQNEDSKLLEVIKEKFGFNLPLSKQYFYYLNDLSPISYHSKDPKVFAHYDKSIYGGWKIFNGKNYILLMKGENIIYAIS